MKQLFVCCLMVLLMSDVNTIINFILSLVKVVGNGYDQSITLIWLYILDLFSGLLWRFRDRYCQPKIKIVSHKMMSGIIFNAIPCLIPWTLSEVSRLSLTRAVNNEPISFAGIIIFIILFFFLLQSVTANFVICGLKVPEKVMYWLNDEINSKLGGK